MRDTLEAARTRVDAGWMNENADEIGARTALGEACDPASRDATAWTTGGALMASGDPEKAMKAGTLLSTLSNREVWHRDVGDSRVEVLAIFDNALMVIDLVEHIERIEAAS